MAARRGTTKRFNKRGNPRAPSRLKVVEWVKKAWNDLGVDIIINSFTTCGIMSSNPDDIHCTKVGNIAENARDALLEEESDIESSEESDDDDESEDGEGESDCDDANEIDVDNFLNV
uniref:DDE-1 domain-containing protein n=1 Tax=Strigamia maritima TaxID=126957 RepID=T1IH49_STRMM